jgi:hypothetical protein
MVKIQFDKCLWVEDFDHGHANPDKFPFDKTYIQHVVNFSDALRVVKSRFGTFDMVILDINLEIGNYDSVLEQMKEFTHPKHLATIKKLPRSHLEDKAGFYVYLYLLYMGFPSDRVCFLTGYKEVSIEESSIKKLKFLMETHGIHKENIFVSDLALKEQMITILNQPELADVRGEIFMYMRDGLSAKAYETIVKAEEIIHSLESSQGKPDLYGKWDRDFIEVGLKSPVGYNKHFEFGEFQKWYQERVDSKYYLLRYGIYLACEDLKERLNDANFARFQKAYFLPKVEKDPNQSYFESQSLFTKGYFVDMLTSLRDMLPITNPVDKSTLYKQIVRFISHDWEAVMGVNKGSSVLSRSEQGYKDQTYFYLMKLLRNWSAHNKLLSFKEEDVAFFLIIAFRAYFEMNSQDQSETIQRYEQVLLQVINPLKDSSFEDEHQKLITKVNQGEIKLNDIFDNLRNKMIDYHINQKKRYYSMSVNLYDILQDIGKDLPECCVEDLMVMLWYGMCDIEFYTHGYNIINVKYDYRKINKLLRRQDDLFTNLYLRLYPKLPQK